MYRYFVCIISPLLTFYFFLVSDLSYAETFCVDSAEKLHSRLDDAASNSTDDTIQIVQGTYFGNFSYNSYNPGDITIEGGYVKVGLICVRPRPVPSASKTVIHARAAGNALSVISNQGYNATIKRLTIKHQNEYQVGTGLIAASYGSSGHPHSGLVEISSNIIENNHSNVSGGGILAASSTEYGSANAIFITHNIIRNNTAQDSGGGMKITSLATPGKTALIHIEGNTIANNTGNHGGGADIGTTGITGGTGVLRIEKNNVYGNLSYDSGGIRVRSYTNSAEAGAIEISNNFIYGNTVTADGGGVKVTQIGDHPNGNTVFLHNTITGNQAGKNGGGVAYGSKTLTFVNNIVRGNKAQFGDDIYFVSAEVNAIAHSNNIGKVFSSWDKTSNNINIDPLFIGNGDYHLQVSSPCREKGTTSFSLPDTDIDGDERVLFGLPDLGADEIIKEYFPWLLFLPTITAKKNN